ncbi:hypothetical protein GCM10023322_19870 [Rugosimonospora acidiphila]|uniref:Uncharacterized protein n=1 Tax=Rugosimonospora acidiphila TaxID=556531 RepID=A0ABP9RPY6_9ACTN
MADVSMEIIRLVGGWRPSIVAVIIASKVPSGATAVALNASVTQPTSDGCLAVYPPAGRGTFSPHHGEPAVLLWPS